MGEASFWDAVEEGVLNVMNEGDELIFVEGEHGNAAGQVDIIEDFIAQGCDLVFFNPVDADAATSCLNLLEEAGIPRHQLRLRLHRHEHRRDLLRHRQLRRRAPWAPTAP